MPLVHQHDAIRQHALTWAGVHPPARRMPPIDSLRVEEAAAFAEVDRLCLNRLIMGSFRYGRAGEPGKVQFDRVADTCRRLRDYERSGDLENLVDAINLLRLEYLEGVHPLAHFGAGFEGQHTQSK
jgi:hypothetical protein